MQLKSKALRLSCSSFAHENQRYCVVPDQTTRALGKHSKPCNQLALLCLEYLMVFSKSAITPGALTEEQQVGRLSPKYQEQGSDPSFHVKHAGHIRVCTCLSLGVSAAAQQSSFLLQAGRASRTNSHRCTVVQPGQCKTNAPHEVCTNHARHQLQRGIDDRVEYALPDSCQPRHQEALRSGMYEYGIPANSC